MEHYSLGKMCLLKEKLVASASVDKPKPIFWQQCKIISSN